MVTSLFKEVRVFKVLVVTMVPAEGPELGKLGGGGEGGLALCGRQACLALGLPWESRMGGFQ